MEFDIKTMPWFIRMDNLTSSQRLAVGEWLLQFFYSVPNIEHADYYTNIGNGSSMGKDSIYWGYWGKSFSKRNPLVKEIKLNFKCVVDSVIYPEVESEAEKQIQELKDTISKAQQQIEELERLQR